MTSLTCTPECVRKTARPLVCVKPMPIHEPESYTVAVSSSDAFETFTTQGPNASRIEHMFFLAHISTRIYTHIFMIVLLVSCIEPAFLSHCTYMVCCVPVCMHAAHACMYVCRYVSSM